MTNPADVRALRQTYWNNGYRPVEVWSPAAEDEKGQPIPGAGKAPRGKDWLRRALREPPDAVTSSVSSLALNTGIVTGGPSGVDIDVPVEPLATIVTDRVEHILGPTPLV